MQYLRVEQHYDALRRHQQFTELLHRVGLEKNLIFRQKYNKSQTGNN